MKTIFKRRIVGLLVLGLLGLLAGCSSPTPASILTSPSSFIVTAGEPAQVIVANIKNASNSSVIWTLSPNIGSLSGNTGLEVSYQPPQELDSDTTVTITATLSGTSVRATTQVAVKAPLTTVRPTLTLEPHEVTLTSGDAPFNFTANVQNSSATVTWSLSENLGSLSNSQGSSVQYTPPVTLSSPTTLTLKAQLEGSTVQDSVIITLRPKSVASINISPRGSPTLTLGAGSLAQTFTVTLPDATSKVDWSLSPSSPTGGSLKQISSTQVEYTPPASVSTDLKVTLTAKISGSSLQDSIGITITKSLPISLTVNSTTATLNISSGPTMFNAQLKNSNSSVTWKLSPDIGSLDTTVGSTVQYTPPKALLVKQVTLTAYVPGTSVQAEVVITLQEPSFPSKSNSPEPIRASLLPAPAGCKSFSNPTGNESISGYPSKISYFPGETLELRVNAPNSGGRYNLNIYQEKNAPILRYTQTGLKAQKYSLPQQPYLNSPNWPVAFSYSIPATWPSGMYNAILAEADTQVCYEVIFIVKKALGATARPIVVLASNYAWQAYNSWGGASYYRCTDTTVNACTNIGGTLMSPIITQNRPNPLAYTRRSTQDYFSLGTFSLMLWLERQGYTFDLITDSDLDNDPNALNGYKVLMLDRHSEYATSRMYDRIEAFLRNGGNLANLGANQLFWKIITKGNQIEVRKDGTNHTLSVESGGLWRLLGRPEAAILGVRYNYAGFNTFSRYIVRDPSHWSLAGTNLQLNQSFGEGCSGFETDTIDTTVSPKNVELIARGANLDTTRTGPAGSEMVFYKHSGGGGVFSVGSMVLGSCINSDATISKILRNAMNRLLQ